jgi:hypothetical protein
LVRYWWIKRATFIGEETGGGYYGNTSGLYRANLELAFNQDPLDKQATQFSNQNGKVVGTSHISLYLLSETASDLRIRYERTIVRWVYHEHNPFTA